MGVLRRLGTESSSFLETDHLVGRSTKASLQLDNNYVSAQHASIRWVGDGWEIKDLGSRNGTLIDDVPAKAGQAYRLSCGNRVSFGRIEQTWELVDDSPPQVMVTPIDGGSGSLFVEKDLLALPSQDDPRATVFRASDGGWKLERDDGVIALTNQQVFEAAGQTWRFSTPEQLSTTSTIDWPDHANTELRRLHLTFRVTLDEEHVEIVVRRGRETFNLGSRSHNYLLLLLARHRLDEAGQSQPETACGWKYQDELTQELRITPERLNIDIFRIRKQFAAIGVGDAAHVIERRPRTRQVRIGLISLSVENI
ncbi:MAG TPA: FHA domain-containing protein [Polyangiaceae bacterium]|nr:FHA domain-containing protein [Polyangiaceae bacterium]